MRGFKFTELQDGEKMVFGPVTFTRTTSVSGGAGPAQQSAAKTNGETIGITDQRVIVEDLNSASKTKIVPNDEVLKVYVKRKTKNGRTTITLTKVQSAGGNYKINMKGLPEQAEAKLQELFPNAELAQESGCFIATATYGSALAPEVVVLQQFRDTRLRQHGLGRGIIKFYERYSPPLADWIADRPQARRWMQRFVLSPLIQLVRRGE